MLSKDVAIVNGMVRTKDSVKVRDAVRPGLVQVGKTLFWHGREGDVVSVQGDIIILDIDGEKYKVRAGECEAGTTGDSKTKDGEEQTIGNYEGYRLVFKNGFVRALEDGFTKFEVLSSMGNGGWTQADVKKLMNKIDARRSGMNDSYTQEIAKQIEDLTKEYNTKDDWSPEARKKALEARRAHKKAQPVEPTQQRQPAKQEIEMSKHASPTPAKEETVNPANIKPNSDLKRWFNVNTIKKKNIKMVEPAVDDKGDFIPGKTELTTATLYRGILKSGENKGRSYTYLKSYDMGEEKGGLIGDDKWDQIRETMHRDDVEKLGLKSFGR
jgi:hypothetical protein